jgi:hypothetical protein
MKPGAGKELFKGEDGGVDCFAGRSMFALGCFLGTVHMRSHSEEIQELGVSETPKRCPEVWHGGFPEVGALLVALIEHNSCEGYRTVRFRVCAVSSRPRSWRFVCRRHQDKEMELNSNGGSYVPYQRSFRKNF